MSDPEVIMVNTIIKTHHQFSKRVGKLMHMCSLMLSGKPGLIFEEDIEWKTKYTLISRLLDITLQKCIMFISLPHCTPVISTK